MCGIFFVRSLIHDKDKLKESCDKASYRGPDNSKFTYFPEPLSEPFFPAGECNYYIGFHRLAINGLNEESNQPFYKNGVD